MSREALINKIKRILELADEDKNGNEHEAASAMRMAQRLMLQHQISMSEVEAFESDEVQESWEFGSTVGHQVNDGTCQWEKTLAHAIARITSTEMVINRGKAINSKGNVRMQTKFIFYGHVEDTEVAAVMYPMFRKMARRFARRKCGGSDWSIYHRSYCAGFADKCYARATQEFSQTEAPEAQEFALVIQKKTDWLEQQIDEHLNLTIENRPSMVVSSAYHAGQRDAQNVDLGYSQHITGGTE